MKRIAFLLTILALCVTVQAAEPVLLAAKDKKPKKPPDPKKMVGQFKKVTREQAQAVEAGKYDAVLDWSRRFEQALPEDWEAPFFRAAALAGKKDIGGAVAAAKQAIASGMPPGRLVAGPREWFAGAMEDKRFAALAEKTGPLVHGPMLGCVTDRSAKIWVRTAKEASVSIRIAPALDLSRASVNAAARATKASDYTAVVDLPPLKPDTEYRYVVLVDGKPVGEGYPASFRTYRPAGTPWKFDVAFGGGAGYTPWKERMWDVVGGRNPLALVLLGDNVYIDAPNSPAAQRYCYYRRQSRPEFRKLTAGRGVYAIWDDHDFGVNDCSGGPEIRTPDWKIPVWNVFKKNWVNAYYGGGEKQPGCWFDFSIGDVDFFMTDSRYYRTPPKGTPEEKRSMFGPAQRDWLLKKLKASKAKFKVLCSAVPWAYGTKPGSLDTWEGFKHEREMIFSCINKNRIDGVVLLSADRHRSDVWKIERPQGYDIYEFESSRLTNIHVHKTMEKALFSTNENSFGLLTFDTTTPDPTVTYRIISIDNKLLHTFTVKKSQLTHK